MYNEVIKNKQYWMKAEDGTGSRHALVVLKEMWEGHPTYFIQMLVSNFGYSLFIWDKGDYMDKYERLVQDTTELGLVIKEKPDYTLIINLLD
jgi:hypothetical protein